MCRFVSAGKQNVTCHRQAMFNTLAYNHYLLQVGLCSPCSTVIILSSSLSHRNINITIRRTKTLLSSVVVYIRSIYCSLIDTNSTSHYTASNGRMSANAELEWMWKEDVMIQFEAPSQHLTERLRKTTKNISHYSQYRSRGRNRKFSAH
jgi:hypothetical protein